MGKTKKQENKLTPVPVLARRTKIGHPAHRCRQLMQVPVLSACGLYIDSKICVDVFLGLRSEIVAII